MSFKDTDELISDVESVKTIRSDQTNVESQPPPMIESNKSPPPPVTSTTLASRKSSLAENLPRCDAKRLPHFDLSHYDVIGFDLDNTLVEYHVNQVMELVYWSITRLLVMRGFSAELLEFDFSPEFNQKGLVLDTRRCNILKLSSDHTIESCYHGYVRLNHEQIGKVYGNRSRQWKETNRMPGCLLDGIHSSCEVVLLKDCFLQPIAQVIAGMVHVDDQKNKLAPDHGGEYTLFEKVRQALTLIYDIDQMTTENPLNYFAAVRSQPERFVRSDHLLALGRWLRYLRSSGKRIFLCTSSYPQYALLVGQIALGPDWTQLFDLVLTRAMKPRFFTKKNQFQRVIPIGCVKQPEPWIKSTSTATSIVRIEPLAPNEKLEFGRIYECGSFAVMDKRLSELMNNEDLKYLYVGDSLVDDLVSPRHASHKLDTLAIVEEILECVSPVNPFWGSFFRTGDETMMFTCFGHPGRPCKSFEKPKSSSPFTIPIYPTPLEARKRRELPKKSFIYQVIQDYARCCIPNVDSLLALRLQDAIGSFVGEQPVPGQTVLGFLPEFTPQVLRNKPKGYQEIKKFDFLPKTGDFQQVQKVLFKGTEKTQKASLADGTTKRIMTEIKPRLDDKDEKKTSGSDQDSGQEVVKEIAQTAPVNEDSTTKKKHKDGKEGKTEKKRQLKEKKKKSKDRERSKSPPKNLRKKKEKYKEKVAATNISEKLHTPSPPDRDRRSDSLVTLTDEEEIAFDLAQKQAEKVWESPSLFNVKQVQKSSSKITSFTKLKTAAETVLSTTEKLPPICKDVIESEPISIPLSQAPIKKSESPPPLMAETISTVKSPKVLEKSLHHITSDTKPTSTNINATSKVGPTGTALNVSSKQTTSTFAQPDQVAFEATKTATTYQSSAQEKVKNYCNVENFKNQALNAPGTYVEPVSTAPDSTAITPTASKSPKQQKDSKRRTKESHKKKDKKK